MTKLSCNWFGFSLVQNCIKPEEPLISLDSRETHGQPTLGQILSDSSWVVRSNEIYILLFARHTNDMQSSKVPCWSIDHFILGELLCLAMCWWVHQGCWWSSSRSGRVCLWNHSLVFESLKVLWEFKLIVISLFCSGFIGCGWTPEAIFHMNSSWKVFFLSAKSCVIFYFLYFMFCWF